MSEITEHLSGYLGELNNYMDRLNHNTLSRRDRQTFFEMSNEYYELFQKSIEEGKDNVNAFPSELLADMDAFNGSIIDPSDDRKLANQYYEFITSRSNDYIQTVEHAELQVEIFRKDAEIMRLQSEKLQMMQRLTDIEIQRDGKLSQVTMEILEVQNSEFFNGRVREIGAWEHEAPETPSAESVPEAQSEPEVPDHVEEKTKPSIERKMVINKDEYAREKEENKDTGPVILKLPYMSKETFMKVTKQIKSMGAKFNHSKKEWYIPAGAGKDTIDSIKNYLDVHDEAIYLKLPPVKKQEFKQMTDQLKKDGARYNPDKKRWYITEDTELNRNKFYRYLPLSVTLFKPEKDSVHGKLDQYKSEAEKKQPASGIQEYQKRETPERV